MYGGYNYNPSNLFATPAAPAAQAAQDPGPSWSADYNPSVPSADDSFYTAPTQPATQFEEDTQEEYVSAVQPYDDVWGRLVPCNPRAETFDLKNEKNSYSLGRFPYNDFIVKGQKISGRHLEISRVQDHNGQTSISISDLSTNGTYVTGHKIGKGRTRKLVHGDEISLGAPGNKTTTEDYRYIFRKSSEPITSGNGVFSHYELTDKMLGKGAFAHVVKAYSLANGEDFACKVITKSRFYHSPKTAEMFQRELAILQSIRHYNITRLVEYFEDESTIYIVMELVSGGDLLEHIMHNGPVAEPQSRIWTTQMVDAVAYIHRKNISHRDLKPENILLTQNPDGSGLMVKLADFGLAKHTNDQTYLNTMCGTPLYLAPEVVLRTQSDVYDKKVDCWSLGVITFSMLTNAVCFIEDESEPIEERMAKRRPDYELLVERGISQAAIDFISKLLVKDPRLRYSITSAREHFWIKDVVNTPPEDFVPSQQSDCSEPDIPGTPQAGDLTLPEPQPPTSGSNGGSFVSEGPAGGMPGAYYAIHRGEEDPSSMISHISSEGNVTSFTRRTTPHHSPSPQPSNQHQFADDCSQIMEGLKLDTSSSSGGVFPMDESAMDVTSTPQRRPLTSRIQQNESSDSWHLVTNRDVTITPGNRRDRAIKPLPKTPAVSARRSANRTPQQSDIQVRDTDRRLTGESSKRKATDDLDMDASPAKEETTSKTSKTTNRTRAASNRQAPDQIASIRGKGATSRAKPTPAPAIRKKPAAQSKEGVRSTRRASGDSDDEEPELPVTSKPVMTANNGVRRSSRRQAPAKAARLV